MGNDERFKRVFSEPVRTQGKLKEIRDNVDLVQEMNLERFVEESQFVLVCCGGSGAAVTRYFRNG